MMRLCCLSLSYSRQFTSKQLDDLKFINLCADMGLDGVDINMANFKSLDKEHLKQIKKTCLDRGLDIACIGLGSKIGRNRAEKDQEFEKTKQGIDVAAFLGAPVVRLFAGYVQPGEKREDVFQLSVEDLRRAAEYGEKVGIVAAIQNHNHNNVTSTGEEMARLLKEVNHPWSGHILDTGQYVGSPGAGGEKIKESARVEAYQSIARTAPLACFVRAKLYRLKTGKEAWLDYDRIFEILRKNKFNGWICLVYEGWEDLDSMHAVPIGAKFLRGHLNSTNP